MQVAVEHSRGSDILLEGAPTWHQLLETLDRIDRDTLVARQLTLSRGPTQPPKGGQRALNDLLVGLLEPMDWTTNSRVFRPRPSLPPWRLSFHRDSIGVVVCTQNVGYLAQKLLTLQIAAGPPSESRWGPSAVDVGALLVPTSDLKSWSRMDSSVATYGDAIAQNDGLSSVLSAPIAILGLDARTAGALWERTDVFPGRAT